MASSAAVKIHTVRMTRLVAILLAVLLSAAEALQVEPWLRARGVAFGDAVSLGSSGGLRGLVSAAPIAAGDVLCSAPLSSALRVDLVDGDWLWELSRLVLGAPDDYGAWYESLKEDGHLDALPLLWDIGELPYAYPPVCERLFHVQTQAGLRAGGGGFDARAWTEAAACVLSRAFVVDAAPRPLAVLSPGADLVNHAPEPAAASPFFLDAEGGRVGVRATRAAPAGPATVSYGARASNDRLFANYGFVAEDNADDEYVVGGDDDDGADFLLFRGGEWSPHAAENLRRRFGGGALDAAQALLRDERVEIEAGLADADGVAAAFLAEKARVLEEGLAARTLLVRGGGGRAPRGAVALFGDGAA